jgi:hypothetical protein
MLKNKSIFRLPPLSQSKLPLSGAGLLFNDIIKFMRLLLALVSFKKLDLLISSSRATQLYNFRWKTKERNHAKSISCNVRL